MFGPREEMAKLVVLVIVFGCLKLLLENLVGYPWWISANLLSNALGFKLCFDLYINLKPGKCLFGRHSKRLYLSSMVSNV